MRSAFPIITIFILLVLVCLIWYLNLFFLVLNFGVAVDLLKVVIVNILSEQVFGSRAAFTSFLT